MAETTIYHRLINSEGFVAASRVVMLTTPVLLVFGLDWLDSRFEAQALKQSVLIAEQAAKTDGAVARISTLEQSMAKLAETTAQLTVRLASREAVAERARTDRDNDTRETIAAINEVRNAVTALVGRMSGVEATLQSVLRDRASSLNIPPSEL